MDEGIIGEPVAVTAFMLNHGPEDWHPNPDFFYQLGAGPMFDLGPYYLSTLTTLMGLVQEGHGIGRVTFPERMITSDPHAGDKHHGEHPDPRRRRDGTSKSGAVGTLVTSLRRMVG